MIKKENTNVIIFQQVTGHAILDQKNFEELVDYCERKHLRVIGKITAAAPSNLDRFGTDSIDAKLMHLSEDNQRYLRRLFLCLIEKRS